jgi:hypothetical protein
MSKADEVSGNILFEEIQKHPKWVSWAVRVGMFVTVLASLVGYVSEKEKTEMVIALAVVIPIAIVAVYLNSNVQLEKIVTTNGLYFRERPLYRKYRVIEKEEIESFSSRNFPFLRYSYGFGWFPTYGRYYNAGGGEGVQLFLEDGRRYFFSTRRKELFEAAIRKLTSSNPKPNSGEF